MLWGPAPGLYSDGRERKLQTALRFQPALQSFLRNQSLATLFRTDRGCRFCTVRRCFGQQVSCCPLEVDGLCWSGWGDCSRRCWCANIKRGVSQCTQSQCTQQALSRLPGNQSHSLRGGGVGTGGGTGGGARSDCSFSSRSRRSSSRRSLSSRRRRRSARSARSARCCRARFSASVTNLSRSAAACAACSSASALALPAA